MSIYKADPDLCSLNWLEALCQSPVMSRSVPNYFNAGAYYQYSCERSRPLIVGGRLEDTDELWFT